MKTVSPASLFRSVRFYGAIVANLIFVYLSLRLQLPIQYIILTFVIVNLIGYFAGVADHYRFEYDETELVITNTWNPFYFTRYSIVKLTRVEYNYFNSDGPGVRIFYDGSKADSYVCATDPSIVKSMAEELDKCIELGKSRRS